MEATFCMADRFCNFSFFNFVFVYFFSVRSIATESRTEKIDPDLNYLLYNHSLSYVDRVKNVPDGILYSLMPFGPLDLQVTQVKNFKKKLDLKNFYLGYVGAALEINPLLLTESFHCGVECVELKKKRLENNIIQIKEILHKVSSYEKLKIIASWGIKNEYRINNVFNIMNKPFEAIPSPKFGLIPSGFWHEVNMSKYLKEIGLNKKELNRIISKMKKNLISSIYKDDDGYIRLIHTGVGDNEAGLIWISPQGKIPFVKQEMKDGKQIVVLKKVENNLFYYETS